MDKESAERTQARARAVVYRERYRRHPAIISHASTRGRSNVNKKLTCLYVSRGVSIYSCVSNDANALVHTIGVLYALSGRPTFLFR